MAFLSRSFNFTEIIGLNLNRSGSQVFLNPLNANWGRFLVSLYLKLPSILGMTNPLSFNLQGLARTGLGSRDSEHIQAYLRACFSQSIRIAVKFLFLAQIVSLIEVFGNRPVIGHNLPNVCQSSTFAVKLESTFNGCFQVNIERKGKPSKWITLNALRVLKRFYG